ncbi:hybrid sensor histidine kinase/response regulator [Chitinophaga sp. sic0106]|uniref:hybrid sensor histidine kinase/response regulator n=1 Tax=Chitinophaga sp. sic0106 TaxID=2854785 RepID=UPI001C45D8F2|nr:hybrid sensor histidine kinase/response regulator [Chitinophaga sp. sic0106]MBV7530146.1 hybrid sensor histidine kinase/response regulator [Chitinophaga sp. sic0106]
MIRFIRKIIFAGVPPDAGNQYNSVIVINALALLTSIFLAVIGSYFYYLTNSIYLIIGVAAECVCFATVIWFNSRQIYEFGTLGTVLTHTVFACYFGALLGPAMPEALITAFLLTFLIGSSFSVYKRWGVRIFCLVIAILLFTAIGINSTYMLIKPLDLSYDASADIKLICWIAMLVLIGFSTWLLINQNDRSLKEVSRLNREKALYHAEINHELRNTIHTIVTFAQLIDSAKLTAAEQQHLITCLKSSSAQALDIINNGLLLTKIEAGKEEESVESVIELQSFLQDKVNIFNILGNLQQKNIVLTCDVEGAISTDRLALTKIVNNLLTNAIKHSSTGATIRITVSKENGMLTMKVSNPGTISKSRIAKLFEPFESANQSRFDSTGLGLYITHYLVIRLKGKITVNAENNVVLFTVQLPVKDAANITAAEEDKVDFDLTGFNILVIEDDLMNQVALSRTLKDKNATVTVTGSANEGIQLMDQKVPDLIITDLNMPEMLGTDLIAILRKDLRLRNIPVILITGQTADLPANSLSSGTIRLHKPFKVKELYSAVQAQLRC